MREIGRVADRQQAELFEKFLLTLGIKAALDEEPGGWVVWIYDEDHVDRAREELERFRSNSDAAVYRDAALAADKLRKAERQRDAVARKNMVDVRQRWSRPARQACPVTYLMIWTSVVVVVAASSWSSLGRLCDKTEPVLTHLFIVPMVDADDGRAWFPQQGLSAVRRGELWRLVTPIFIHFDLLHILFNMLWLRDLGTAIEYRRGSLRFLLLVLAIAVVSNLGQYTMSGPSFGGMSGVVFGLFGYVWIKSRYAPELGFFLHPNTVFLMLAWLFVCMTGAVGSIANAAHTLGLASGIAIAYAPIVRRKVARRRDH